MYMQPVVVQQPVMMMQPQPMMMNPMMMQQPPAPQGPTIIINKGDDNEFNCPSCAKGNLLETKKFTCVTCIITMIFPCAICCFPECAY